MVLYTIIGGLVGGVLTYVGCKVFNVDFRASYGISVGGLMTTFGTVIGGAIGFGLGVGALMNGTHLFNRPEL